MTMSAEESKQIEEEIMAELRSALGRCEIQPPASIISIPKVVRSPRDSSTLGTEEGSMEEEEKEMFVKVKDAPPHRRTSSASLEDSVLNDSFMLRMTSSMSSIGGSSTGLSESSSQRFYIGTVKEEGEEGSIQSHVSFGADDMSHDELMDVVHRLYGELKKADETLAREKKRRHSREKNLLKLAKELGTRKDATDKLLSKIGEVRLLAHV